MKRTLALLLAIVMMLSLLAACGENKGGAEDKPGEDVTEITPTNKPDDNKEPEADPSAEVRLTLNKTEITLNAEGATFQLKYSTEPEVDADAAYTSGDKAIATVSGDGTITAVAPGTAVITVECGGAKAECTVKCDWAEETPAPETTPPIMPVPDTPAPSTPAPSTPAPNTPAPADPPAATSVDLAAFYEAILSSYEMGAMDDISGVSDLLDTFYAGLSGIATKQCLVCLPMMTSVVSELVLIEVSDAGDVDAVKGILQARIDVQAGGGAWYPDTVDGWKNNSRIVSNGNYIMMIVHRDCDSIVNDFNALF